jgi:hypothetical protein
MPTVTGQNVYIASDSVNFRTGEVTKANISYNSGSDKLFFSGDLVFQDPTASITGRLEVSHIEVTGAHNPWAGTDTQYGAIYLSDEGRGLLGNFGGDYARPMITANSNKLTIGSNGTSVIRDIDVHPGNGAGAAMSNFNVFTSGVKRMTVTRTGNIGFGGGLADNPSKAFVVDLQDSRMDILNGSVKIRYASNNDALTLTPSVGNEARILAADTDTNSAHPLKIAADQIRFTTSGSAPNTEVMRLTAEGNVGIGTNDPDVPLEVTMKSTELMNLGSSGPNATLQFAAGSSTIFGGIGARQTNTSQSALGLLASTTNASTATYGDMFFSTRENDSSDFSTTAGKKAFSFVRYTSALMTIMRDGKVGIGTNAPGMDLDISGSLGSIRATSSAGGANLYLNSASSNLTRIRWNSAAGSFAIRDDSNSSDRLSITSDGDIVSIDNKKFKGATYSSSYIKFEDDTKVSANSDIIFDVNGSTELMRLEEGGKVGIGTNDPETLLHVKAADTVKGVIKVEGGKNTVSSVDEINSEIQFGSNDPSVGGAGNVGGKISSITEYSNGAFVGLGFYTYHQTTSDLSERMRITHDGKVGIGLTNPSILNGAANTLVVGSGAGNEGITIYAGNSSAASLYLSDGTAGDQAYRGYITYSHAAEKLSLGAGGLTRITATNAGLVGIGTANPDYRLTVDAGASNEIARFRSTDNDALISIQDDTDAVYIGLDASADVMSIGFSNTVGSSSNVNITTGGRVGIGTNNPGSKIDIKTAANTNGIMVKSATDGSNVFNQFIDSSDNGHLWLYPDGGTANVKINTAGDTFFNGGNVGIGVDDPDQKLEVNGNIRIPNEGKIVFGSAGTTPNDYLELYDVGTGDTLLRLVQDGVKRFSVQGVNGHVYMQNKLQIDIGSNNSHTGEISFNTQYDTAFIRSSYTDPAASTETYLAFHANTAGASNGTVAEQMRIAGNKVGIGTNSPSGVLDVGGDGADIFLHSNDFKIARIQPRGSSTNYDRGLFSLFNQTVEAVRIDSYGPSWFNSEAGNHLGIGTVSPNKQVEIRAAEPYLRLEESSSGGNKRLDLFVSNSTGVIAANQSAQTMMFQTVGENRMTIEAGGDVGIGTTNPQTKLTVGSDGNEDGIELRESGNLKFKVRPSSSHAYLSLYDSTVNEDIRFNTNGDSWIGGGSLAVGMTDPSTSRVRIKGGTNDASTNALQCIDSSSAQLFYVRNDGVVGVDHNYFYVSASAGAYVQTDLRVRGSLSNDAGTLAINGDVNFDSNTLFVDSSNNRVGIGTATPSKNLSVYAAGNAQVGISGTNVSILTISDPNSHGQLNTYNDGTFRINSVADAAGTQLVLSGSNVGIKTARPIHPLTVKGTISRLNSSNIQVINLGVTSEAGDITVNNAGGVTKARINSNGASYFNGGNVGINVTDPDEKLEVAGKTHLGGRGQDGGAYIAYATLSETQGGAATILGNAVYAGTGSNVYRKTYSDAGNFISMTIIKVFAFHTNVTGSAGSTEYNINNHEQVRIDLAGNVGIGTITPSQLLDVNGDAAFAQYLYHQGDEDTNIKFVDDDFMINVGGATFFRATETTQNTIKLNSDNEDTDFYLYGNNATPGLFMRGSDREVGINTTNPTASLHVVGNARIKGSSSDGVLSMENAAGSQTLRIDQNSIRTTTNNNLTFLTNGNSNSLVLQQSTNYLGIGAVPTSAFHVSTRAVGLDGAAVTTMTKTIATSTIGAKLSFTGGSNTNNNIIGGLSMGNVGEEYAGMYTIDGGGSATTHLAFFAGNSTSTNEGIRLLSDGKVGIGTTNPEQKLHVEGSANGNVKALIENTNVGSDAYATLGFQNNRPHSVNPALFLNGTNNTNYAGADSLNMYHYGAYNLGFVTNNLLRMTVSGNGNVGIGSASPTEKLDVAADTDVSAAIGKAHVGLVGSDTDVAGFAHVDSSLHTQAAVRQTANGQTKLGCASSQDITFFQNNNQIGGFNTSKDFFVDSDTLYVDVSEEKVGIGSNAPAETLDVVGLIRFAHTRANNTQKIARLLVPEYNNSHGQFLSFMGTANETSNAVSYGGGTSAADAATLLLFYTASAVNTTVGTERMRITHEGRVGIGTNAPGYKLEVNGSIVGTSKSFLIDHPTQTGKKLMHACIEGPENGVYFRGRSQETGIQAPEYWSGLVDIDSMTVDVTPIGPNQSIYIDRIDDNGDIGVGSNTTEPLNYFYVVYGERKDIDKLEIVKDTPTPTSEQNIVP